MRPIKLEFAGLHSYRERQEIDFTQLMSGGLFGIFGRTGSGKSTILDAITLALYGTVDRAERNTRGILNQSEQQLWVKFTFALTAADGDKTYRVERSFKREDETAIRAAHSRLVAIDAEGGETVLEDKPSNVTAQVQGILGLRVEDFTRAVVLPQGKFAEFLHQEPRGRREMLQRLFSLTRYGDQLAQKLKAQVDETGGRLKSVEGEQQGLGDASADAVAAGAARLGAADEAVAQAETALDAAERAHAGWQKVWELQEQLTQVEAGLAAWRVREAEAGAWKAELHAANRAEPVRPALAERAEARRQSAETGPQLTAAEAARDAAEVAHQQADTAWKATHAARQADLGPLTERQFKLKQAVALEAEVQELAGQVREMADRVARGTALTQQTKIEVDRLDQEMAVIEATRSDNRAKLTAAQVEPERRQQVRAAVQALHQVEDAEAARRQEEKRLEGRRTERASAAEAVQAAVEQRQGAAERLAAQEERLRMLEGEPPVLEADLRAEADWLIRTEAAVAALEPLEQEAARLRAGLQQAEAERVPLHAAAARAEAAEKAARAALEQARALLAQAREGLEAAQRQNMASLLSAGLTEGQACPVCGSAHHPHPAGPEALDALHAARQAVTAAETAETQAGMSLDQAARLAAEARGKVEAATVRAEAAQQAVAAVVERLEAARLRLPEVWRAEAPAALTARLAAEQQAHQERRDRLDAWRKDVELARREREELAQAAGQAASRASSAEATLVAREKAMDDAAAELAAKEKAVAERTTALDLARGDMAPDQLEAENRRIDEADRTASALSKALTAIEGELRDKEDARKAKQALYDKYSQALRERENEHALKQEQHRTRVAQLTELAGGAPAAPQLQAVEAELNRLETAEAKAREAAAEAARQGSQAVAALAAARTADDLAARRLERAESALAQMLLETGFADAAGAEAALRPAALRQDLERVLKEYDLEGDRLNTRRAALERDMAGRRLDEAAWQSHQAALVAARQTARDARDERTRAAQAHEELLRKQERWNGLEEERRKLSDRLSHLSDLQMLLRGNAFVEFLAEGQLNQLAQSASERLGQLTRHRYALEIDSGGGFVIRDDANGGLRRPVSTLSGGETFLSSLALALTLSAQIQLRGRHPLEFFFLDEGFGTLDPDLLTLVVDTLERLHFERLHVGIISHVPELRARLQRRLVVEPAEAGGSGSRIRLEMA